MCCANAPPLYNADCLSLIHIYTDPAFKGADSRELLREAWRRIQAKGYTLGNVDVTIIAQAPKMLPHIPQMRVFIAEDLGCHMDDVNVKATTTEKLGFTGRGEGIACEAVALSLIHISNGMS